MDAVMHKGPQTLNRCQGGGGVLLFLDFCTQVCHFGISNPTNRKMDSATHTNPSLGITKYCKL